MVTARLSGIATAFPPAISQRSMWDDCFGARYGDLRGARRVWDGAGVHTRHAVVDPRVEDLSRSPTGARMQRYLAEALPLANAASSDALLAAGASASDIDLLVVVSCTGYATPGLDLMLGQELAMPATLQRLCIGHMGCYAALPGLAAASDAVVARGLTALVVCVELTSLHVQPPSPDFDQLVSHALFSDAAAAAVIAPSGPGFEVIDTVACTDAAHQGAMTWQITDLGFRMTLSPRVPSVLAHAVGPAVDMLLGRNHVARTDVAGWAIHPGGPRILDVCAHALDLDDDAMTPSRETLRDHGNCSSGTVLVVLGHLLAHRAFAPGDHVVALAFGPGLSLYASLLRTT